MHLPRLLSSWIDLAVRKAPSYYSQLISQNCHGHAKTWLLLKSLLVNVVCHHLQETFEHLLSVSKNRKPTRKTRCNEIIFQEAMPELVMARMIIELCELNNSKRETRISLKDAMKSLLTLVNIVSFWPMILINQSNMIACLPTADVFSVSSLFSYNHFPDNIVTIAGQFHPYAVSVPVRGVEEAFS